MTDRCVECGQILPKKRQPLSPRQMQVFTAVSSYIAQHGYAPSLKEIAAEVGLRAESSAHELVHVLQAKGWLKVTPGKLRSIEVVPE